MKMFDRDKDRYVSALVKNINSNERDRSRKGFLDKDIANLVHCINESKDYYTTSSCAGRIILFGKPLSGIKKDAIWYIASHDFVDKLDLNSDIFNRIKQNKNEVLLKQESPIMHICARNLEKAQKIVDIAKRTGFKHSGIMSTSKRIMVEIMGSEKIEIPIYDGETLFIDQTFLDFALDQSNKSLKRSRDKLNLFQKEFEIGCKK